MQCKPFPLKPPGLVLHGTTNHHECKLLHIHTLEEQHMRDNCTHLQIALELSCSRAKSALGCSIHLNPSEQLQKLPPAVTPITMSTCTTFICSFFFVLKNDGLSEQQCLSIVSVFVFYQLQIHYLQQSTIMLTNTVHHRFSVVYVFPPFLFQFVFFSKLGETVRKCLLLSAECEGLKL